MPYLHFSQEPCDLDRYECFKSKTPVENLLFEFFHRYGREQVSNISDITYQPLFEDDLVLLGVPSLEELFLRWVWEGMDAGFV